MDNPKVVERMLLRLGLIVVPIEFKKTGRKLKITYPDRKQKSEPYPEHFLKKDK